MASITQCLPSWTIAQWLKWKLWSQVYIPGCLWCYDLVFLLHTVICTVITTIYRLWVHVGRLEGQVVDEWTHPVVCSSSNLQETCHPLFHVVLEKHQSWHFQRSISHGIATTTLWAFNPGWPIGGPQYLRRSDGFKSNYFWDFLLAGRLLLLMGWQWSS